jgi:hypothetical protein
MKIVFKIFATLPLNDRAKSFNDIMESFEMHNVPMPRVVSNEVEIGTTTVKGIKETATLADVEELRKTIEKTYREKLPDYKIRLEGITN